MICSKDATSKLKRLTCDHVMAMTKKMQVEPKVVEHPGKLLFSC